VGALLNLRVVRWFWRLFDEIGEDDVFGLAAEMAYRFLFALFPFLIFLAAFVGYVAAQLDRADLFDEVMQYLALFLPPDIQRVIEEWVRGVLSTQSTELMTVGAIVALWSAAGGVGSLIKGLNRAYDVAENRPLWLHYAFAVITTVVIAISLLCGVALYTVGELILSWAVESLEGGGEIWAKWNAIRAAGAIIALGTVLGAMYALLPNQRVDLRHTWPGTLFATAAWIVLTIGFGIYVSRFGSFDKVFGSLGAAVVLMVWMYAVAVILLVGGEINALASGRKREQRAARTSSS
jgi:membrane protein